MLLAVRQDIATMRTRGAGEIGRRAALALAEAARQFRGDDVSKFRAQLLEAAKALAESRPTAVSLRNALNDVLASAFEAQTVKEATANAASAAQRFSRRVDEAKAKIAQLGAGLMGRNEVVLTHCHSTVAGGVLVLAHQKGKVARVFADETRPFRQGLITSRQLAEAKVPVTLIVDAAALHVLETQKVTRVVIGADTIAADGSLYNKVGTRMVTLAAKSLGIPVLCAAESYKFSPYTLEGEPVVIEEREPAEVASPTDLAPGVLIHNPVFDRTPPDQVTHYVTEDGVLAPDQISTYMSKLFGGAHRWI